MYPLRFINNIVNNSIKSINNLEDSHIIPPNLFDVQKPFNLIEIPFCVEMRTSRKILFENFINLQTVNSKYQ